MGAVGLWSAYPNSGNYILAWCVTQVCPALKPARSFKLCALYELGRIVDSEEERGAVLSELIADRPTAKPAEVIVELKAKLGLPAASHRVLPAAMQRVPAINQRIDPSLVAEMADLLGDKLADFVILVGECGAVAVCDALIEFQRHAAQKRKFLVFGRRLIPNQRTLGPESAGF